MRIQALDQITDEAIDLSQMLALDDPSQTFKMTLLQLRDFLLGGATASDDIVYDTLARPDGAVAGNWYPVLIPANYQGANITIETTGGHGSIPMNNNQFAGFIHGGGWSDGGDQLLGQLHQYDMSERSIYAVHSCTESEGGVVFYVHEAAFPVTVKYHTKEVTGDPITGQSIQYGTSLFTFTSTPGTPSGDKTRVMIDFGLGSGTYSNIQGKMLGSRGWQNVYDGGIASRDSTDNMRVEMSGNARQPRLDLFNGAGTLVGRLQWNDANGFVSLGHESGGSYMQMHPDHTYYNKEVRTGAPQGGSANAFARKDYVDSKLPAAEGNGGGGQSLTFDATGRKMATVTIVVGSRIYPLTFQLNGNTDWWLPIKEGWNDADDHDVGVSIVLNGASSTCTIIKGAAQVNGLALWEITCW